MNWEKAGRKLRINWDKVRNKIRRDWALFGIGMGMEL